MALSCVTVLAIATASFLAVSNLAMKLSNRDYAKSVSRQLAEMGLERALRSFGSNTFSSWNATSDTAIVTQNLTLSATNYGTSLSSATCKIRVDHFYDIVTSPSTRKRGVIWNPRLTYAVDDYVSYQGVWYICYSTPSSKEAPSDTTKWRSAPEAWSAYATYRVGNIALVGGSAYRCLKDHINQAPPNATTYWTASAVAAWSSATTYSPNDVAVSGGVAYRCIASHSNQVPPNNTYWLSAPVIYSEGVAVLPDSGSTTIKTQLRATVAPAPLFPNALGATTLVDLKSTATIDSYSQPLTTAWSSSTTYVVGDVVRTGTSPSYVYYRCKATTKNDVPPNIAYWLPARGTPDNALGYSAVIAGGNTSGTAVAVSANVTMGGYIAAPSITVSPYTPQVSFAVSSTISLKNPNGTVTSPHASAANVDQTRISRSPYIPQFDIQTVTGGTDLPSPSVGTTMADISPIGTVTLGSPTDTTPRIYNVTGTMNGGTLLSGLYLSNSGDDLRIDGPVILNVTGRFGTNRGQITITTNGSLEVYFTGTMEFVSRSGTGILNQTLDPKRCILIGTNTSNVSGDNFYYADDPFYGIIYMPNAMVCLDSGVTVYGAISAKNVSFLSSGTYLHYDTSLRTAGSVVDTSLRSSGTGPFLEVPFKITELRELIDPSERVVLP